MHEFPRTLRDLYQRSGKSLQRVARDGDLDPAYLRKMASGEKRNPSALTLIKLNQGLIGCPTILGRDPELVHAFSILLLAWLSDAATRS